MFQVILNISKISARARLRARFCARSTYGMSKFRFFTWNVWKTILLTISIHFQSFWINNNDARVRQSLISARASMGK